MLGLTVNLEEYPVNSTHSRYHCTHQSDSVRLLHLLSGSSADARTAEGGHSGISTGHVDTVRLSQVGYQSERDRL